MDVFARGSLMNAPVSIPTAANPVSIPPLAPLMAAASRASYPNVHSRHASGRKHGVESLKSFSSESFNAHMESTHRCEQKCYGKRDLAADRLRHRPVDCRALCRGTARIELQQRASALRHCSRGCLRFSLHQSQRIAAKSVVVVITLSVLSARTPLQTAVCETPTPHHQANRTPSPRTTDLRALPFYRAACVIALAIRPATVRSLVRRIPR